MTLILILLLLAAITGVLGAVLKAVVFIVLTVVLTTIVLGWIAWWGIKRQLRKAEQSLAPGQTEIRLGDVQRSDPQRRDDRY